MQQNIAYTAKHNEKYENQSIAQNSINSRTEITNHNETERNSRNTLKQFGNNKRMKKHPKQHSTSYTHDYTD